MKTKQRDAIYLANHLVTHSEDDPLGPEVRQWVVDAMRRYLAGEELDAAFGLDRASRLRQRNQALRDAATLLAADGAAPWQVAVRLEKAIARFQARVLPMYHRNPTTELAPVDEALRLAHLTGCRLPTTARQLHGVIN